jgi:hypothetical protein
MAWSELYSRTSTYDYVPATWLQAKERAKQILVQNLRNPYVEFTTYGDLVNALKPIIDFVTPRNAVFHCLLGQISDDEEEAGRGLLSALVVHSQDLRPGAGFYEGAEQWGRDITDRDKCWMDEVKRLNEIWK